MRLDRMYYLVPFTYVSCVMILMWYLDHLKKIKFGPFGPFGPFTLFYITILLPTHIFEIEITSHSSAHSFDDFGLHLNPRISINEQDIHIVPFDIRCNNSKTVDWIHGEEAWAIFLIALRSQILSFSRNSNGGINSSNHTQSDSTT